MEKREEQAFRWLVNDLKKEIKQLKARKKYGLVWEEKPEQVVEQCKKELPVLKEDKTKEIKTDKSKPVNILIEGDNYHALSVLNYTHKRKIDVIYIDPPYNTGAKDWKYNNDFVDSNDQWRHSKWLSFMNHRLKLAKNLLSNRGVLICTIDQNEQETLGLLIKELFTNKEIVCVTIVHNPSGIQGKNFSFNNEYAYFVFPKGEKSIAFEERNEENADVRQFMNTAKGKGTNYLRSSGKKCFYPVLIKNNVIVGFGNVCDKSFHPQANVYKDNGIIEVYPIDSNGIERKWVFSRPNVETIKNELSVKYNKRTKKFNIIRTKKSINYKTVWTGEKLNAKTYGTQLLNNIIGKEFPFPKSLYAVEECIKAVVHNKNKATILDFFAGSGTTGHAVLDLNLEDNGSRKFILCTNNENNICSEICFPRIKRVIKGYQDLKNFRIMGLGGNLKYYKTDFVDAEPTDLNKKKLVDKSTEMLCLKEDCFDEIKKNNNFSIFTNSQNKNLGIIYDDSGIEPFKKEAKKLNKKFTVYVFSLDESAREEEFEDIKKLVNLKPIPAVILNVYKQIFK